MVAEHARYATVDDVAARLGRPLSDAERPYVQALVDDAETIVRTRIPDLDERVESGRLSAAVVRLVLVSMVLRVLRNPGGYRSESAGDYSYTVDSRAASGYLGVLPDEWRWLGIGDGAFTITPYARWRRCRWWIDGWPCDPLCGPPCCPPWAEHPPWPGVWRGAYRRTVDDG